MKTPIYEPYHIHTYSSNCLTQPDSTMSIKNYADVFAKRDHHVLCISEHGNRGDVWKQFEICEKHKASGYNMTPLAACEAYFVPDRNPALKDSRNYHMVLIAKNMDGFYDLNLALSEANITGFYGKARIDFEILSKLNRKNFIITTACVAGILGDDAEYMNLFHQLKDIAGDSLRLEIQHHPQDIQKKINTRALKLHKEFGIPLIYGTDSHYINHEDSIMREELKLASNITYKYEDEFDLFLPTNEEVFAMLKEQGVLSTAQIEAAMENTLELREFEGVAFDRNRKIPNPRKDLTVEERKKLFRKMVCDGYIANAGMPTKEEAIEIHKEMDTVTDTDSQDYFILHKMALEDGVNKYGGILTKTSRGSAASFVSNYALNFTTINRLRCPVTLYPERFISKDRLAAGSNPD